MNANERLAMMAEDYERRAAILRAEARGEPRAAYRRSANRTALEYERRAKECRDGIARNTQEAAPWTGTEGQDRKTYSDTQDRENYGSAP